MNAGGDNKGRIHHRVKHSADEVVAISVARFLSSLPVIRDFRYPLPSAATLIGILPLLAVIAELVDGETVSWFVWSTAAIYGVLIVAMVLAACDVWQKLVALSGDLDAMLEVADQEAMAEWLSRALRWPRQILALVLGIAASTWVGIKLSGPLGSYADHGGLAYHVTIGWTGGIGALTVYWLWGAPLYYPLTRIKEPKLDWVVPLQTPAIQRLSRLTVSASRWSTFGLLLFMSPIAATVIVASGEVSVWILSVFPVIFAFVTVLACSVIPQIVLQDLLRRGRRETLAEIRAVLPTPTNVFRNLDPTQLQAVQLYQSIANSSVSTLDWKRFVEYLLLLLSALVPVAIALAGSLGS